jgi:hypothetical protein
MRGISCVNNSFKLYDYFIIPLSNMIILADLFAFRI